MEERHGGVLRLAEIRLLCETPFANFIPSRMDVARLTHATFFAESMVRSWCFSFSLVCPYVLLLKLPLEGIDILKHTLGTLLW